MTALMDPEFWARLLGIILIDISLAGDNALVIALAVRELPPHQQLLGRIWGTVGAVGLRVAFIVAVSLLLSIPLLQLAGGLALIWIAVRLSIVLGMFVLGLGWWLARAAARDNRQRGRA